MCVPHVLITIKPSNYQTHQLVYHPVVSVVLPRWPVKSQVYLVSFVGQNPRFGWLNHHSDWGKIHTFGWLDYQNNPLILGAKSPSLCKSVIIQTHFLFPLFYFGGVRLSRAPGKVSTWTISWAEIIMDFPMIFKTKSVDCRDTNGGPRSQVYWRISGFTVNHLHIYL